MRVGRSCSAIDQSPPPQSNRSYGKRRNMLSLPTHSLTCRTTVIFSMWQHSQTTASIAASSARRSMKTGRASVRGPTSYALHRSPTRARHMERLKSQVSSDQPTSSHRKLLSVSVPTSIAFCRAVRPNPSLKRSANGRPPGPGRWYAVHFHRPGPGVLPLSPA